MTRNRERAPRERRTFALAAALLAVLVGAAVVPAKHARVGTLWDEYGASGEEGWGGTALVWPGGFWKEDYGSEDFAKSSASYKGFLYGYRNFTVPSDANWSMTVDVPANTVLPYYVVVRDIKNTPPANGFQLINRSVKLTYRSNPAAITTDGVANTPPETPDTPEDPNLPADVRVVSYYRNNAGMRTVRTVYGFAHPAHDDYLIWHYNFTNTGQYCCPNGIAGGDSNVTHSNTLQDFHFSNSLWFMDRDESGRKTGSSGENTGDNLNNYKGHQVAAPYAPADAMSDTKVIYGQRLNMNLGTAKNYGDLRVQYAWDGDSPIYLGEDSGDPERITGRMMASRWPGVALIHADTSPTDRADDPAQPQRSDYDNHNRMPQINAADLPAAYEFLYRTMTPSGPLVAGGLNNRFQVDALRAGVPYGANAPNPKFTGSETIFSMGSDAWDLAPGQSVNIIEAAAVGGIPYQETVELGKRLRLSDAELAEQGLARLTEEQRLAKYFSVEDSLFTILRRAQDMIGRSTSTLADLDTRIRAANIGTPPNAATFVVNAGAGRVNISWTAPATRAGEVTKYRVYRARGSRVGDFPWTRIAEVATGTTSLVDQDVAVGIQYFYYLVTVNAAGVESSPHMARTSRGVRPSTAASTDVSNSSVYVVPNPYDARYQLNTFQASKGDPLPEFAGQVVFYGLPDNATIHIYTLDGVEVAQVAHTASSTASSGTEAWDLRSRNGQPVVSGVYIYVVESDAGNAVGKLVIGR